jgi:hypothetical protein
MPRVVPSQIVSLIDFHFAHAKTAQPGRGDMIDVSSSPRLSAILRLVDELPDELITVSGDDYNRLTDSVETIRNVLEMWTSHGSTAFYLPTKAWDAVVGLRRSLVALPDQSVPAATAGLPFVADPALRESLRQDIATANSALHNGEWKAATVLGGAVIEALLLWAIQQEKTNKVSTVFSRLQAAGTIPAKADPRPDYWALDIIKQVAGELKLIEDPTIKLVSLAQGFRNLIHPGKAIRTGEACNRGTALTALAAVERVIVDLTP